MLALPELLTSLKDFPAWFGVMIVIGLFFIIILSMVFSHIQKRWKSEEERETAEREMYVEIEKEKTKRVIAASDSLTSIYQNENAREIIINSTENRQQSAYGLKQEKIVKQKIKNRMEEHVEQCLYVILPEKGAPALHKKSNPSSLPKKKKRSS